MMSSYSMAIAMAIMTLPRDGERSRSPAIAGDHSIAVPYAQ
jgi:hypothetical protein